MTVLPVRYMCATKTWSGSREGSNASQICWFPIIESGNWHTRPFATTDNGNTYIMVVGDYFSKWTEAYAIPDHTAQTVADKLITELICRFGCPYYLHTDQGREFESNLFRALCEKLAFLRHAPHRIIPSPMAWSSDSIGPSNKCSHYLSTKTETTGMISCPM